MCAVFGAHQCDEPAASARPAHRIGHRWDTEGNASLEWQWLAYDDRWRVVARFEDGAAVTEPFEQVLTTPLCGHHHAGLAGQGGSSYIDLVICRDRDTDTESNGFESRELVSLCELQNWRADVVALAAATPARGDGDLLERVTYDPYGIPFATHPTDLTFGATSGVSGYGMPDGVLNNDDYNYFLALYTASDWRADWNRDGTIDAADNTAYLADKAAATGSWGRGVLSNRSNILGYAGYVHEPATGAAGSGHGTLWHVRHRVLHSGLGRWVQRDPLEYLDGVSLFQAVVSNPVARVDPTGLTCPPNSSIRPVIGLVGPAGWTPDVNGIIESTTGWIPGAWYQIFVPVIGGGNNDYHLFGSSRAFFRGTVQGTDTSMRIVGDAQIRYSRLFGDDVYKAGIAAKSAEESGAVHCDGPGQIFPRMTRASGTFSPVVAPFSSHGIAAQLAVAFRRTSEPEDLLLVVSGEMAYSSIQTDAYGGYTFGFQIGYAGFLLGVTVSPPAAAPPQIPVVIDTFGWMCLCVDQTSGALSDPNSGTPIPPGQPYDPAR